MGRREDRRCNGLSNAKRYSLFVCSFTRELALSRPDILQNSNLFPHWLETHKSDSALLRLFSHNYRPIRACLATAGGAISPLTSHKTSHGDGSHHRG